MKVLIPSIGGGIGLALIGMYRSYKGRRRSLPTSVRNAGFWTDRRLYRTEALVFTLALSAPCALVVLAAADGVGLLGAGLAILFYPAMIYVLMLSVNRSSDEEIMAADSSTANSQAERQIYQRDG